MSTLLLACIAPRVHAEKTQLKFDRVEGLETEFVQVIYQDRNGFMWIGLQGGLHRYDGRQLVEYTHDPHDPTSLSGDVILSIHQDHQGFIWVGTKQGGLSRYNPSTDAFKWFKHNPNDSQSISGNSVTEVYEDSAHRLWVGTWGKGLNLYERETGKFKRYRHVPNESTSLIQDDVFTILEDNKQTIWIGTNGGVCRYDPEIDGFQSVRNTDKAITSIRQDKDGVIWTGSWGAAELRILDPEKNECRKFPLENPGITTGWHLADMCVDRNNTIWAGLWDYGLARLDRSSKRFVRYEHDPLDPHSLSNTGVISLFEDQSGILWIGTQEGLNKLVPYKQAFRHIKSEPHDPKNSLSHSTVNSICEGPAGDLWIATIRGLNHMDTSGNVAHYRHDPNNPNSLGEELIRTVSGDPYGRIYIGTDDGLEVLNASTGRFTHYTMPDEFAVFSLFAENKESVWVGTVGSLFEFNPMDGSLVHHQVHSSSSPPSDGCRITNVLVDSGSGAVWLGTVGEGLYRFDRENGEFSHFPTRFGHPDPSFNYAINDMIQAPDGSLWIATDAGLCCFHPGTETFERFTMEDGFPDDILISLLRDDSGRLWTASRKALIRFDPDDGSVKSYGKGDGLVNSRYLRGASARSQDGRLLFGGMDGIDVFHPDRVRDNPHAPPVAFTSISVSGEEHLSGMDPSYPAKLTLPFLNNSISFRFAALDFTNPPKNTFRYRMEGFEDEWHQSSHYRADYANLPAGDYVFRVQAANSDGVWNTEGASVTVSIIPPFWQSLWFRILFGLLLVGAVMAVDQLRVRTVQRRRRELEKKVGQRTEELRAKSEELQKANADQARLLQERQELIDDLQQALDRIKVLKGLIPICAACKKVRDDEGYWKRIEDYLHEHSDADFTHGICPDCVKELYPDLNIYED